MPQLINLESLFPNHYFLSVKNYILISSIIFLSGIYYYYRIAQTLMMTTASGTEHIDSVSTSNYGFDVFHNIILILRRHRLLAYIIVNTCCASVALFGKILTAFLFGPLSNQEVVSMKKFFRRFVQTKLTFLIFISHHNLLEDIMIWMPWMAVQILCLILLELSSFRVSNAYNIVSDKRIQRRILATTIITGLSSLLMMFIISWIKEYINYNYFLFLGADCTLLLIQSLFLCIKVLALMDINGQNHRYFGSHAYSIDLFYELLRDCVEFVNYLHMIFYSQLAITYCCIFLIVQTQHYYTRISTRIKKHWQQREISNHINNTYAYATDEDLKKNEQCTICWQSMKFARKLPCAHIFHEHCLRRWLEQDSSCAICRQTLTINLFNVRRPQQNMGIELNNALHMFLDGLSIQNNRIATWLYRLFFDPVDQEQAVRQISEMFPQISVDLIRHLVNNTGSLNATIELLLGQNAQNPPNDQNGNLELNVENSLNTADEDDSSDENSGSDLDADDNHSQGPIPMESNSNIPDKTFPFMRTNNDWLNKEIMEMFLVNRRKYLNSQKADDIRDKIYYDS